MQFNNRAINNTNIPLFNFENQIKGFSMDFDIYRKHKPSMRVYRVTEVDKTSKSIQKHQYDAQDNLPNWNTICILE
jgi:uncharacterized membrane protein YjjP (DUF1212 family)